MPFFVYKGKTSNGKPVEGKIDANDRDAALALLQKENLFIISLEKSRQFKPLESLSSLFQKVPLKEKIMFTSQMSVMIKSGLPVLESLKIVLKQTQNPKMTGVLTQVAQDISSGLSFSLALSKHPKVFPKTYIKIIESGEKSGKLDQVLLKLSKELEKDYDLMGKIKTALMYPIFILLVLLVVMIIVLVYVMPQLKNLFDEVGVPLPLPTRVILFFSGILVGYWWLIIILLIIGGIFLKRYLSTDKGSYAFDLLKLKLPVVKTLLTNIYMSRFARSLSSLVASGVPMLDVLETTKDVVGSAVFKKEIETITKKVETGSTVSVAMKDSTHFPVVVRQLIAVGEKTGKTDYVLKNLSRFLEKEAENTSKSLTSLLEPILMVVLGIGVAIVIASVIMPIYGLVEVIK